MAMVQVPLLLDGRIVIGIEGSVLWHRVEAFGLGRTRRYDLARISDFRQGEIRHAEDEVVWSVAFTYKSKPVHLTTGLTEAETQQLARSLAAYLPVQCRAA